MPYFFPRKSIATAGCSTLGLSGLLDGDVNMYFYLLLGLSPVVMKGYHFRQVGRNNGNAGVLHEFSRVAGAYPPPNMWSKGGICEVTLARQ